MSNSQVPFYAQAAVLDRCVRSFDPEEDPDALEVIVEMLRVRGDLRRYFFSGKPDPAWAAVLWDHGFFDEPPPPEETEAGRVLPRWDVKEYLIAVANEVPHIVPKHVESVSGQGWYISRAIRALRFIPVEQSACALERVIQWLQDPLIARAIASETYELMVKLAQKGKSKAAFALFEELTAPMAPADVKRIGGLVAGGEALCKLASIWGPEYQHPVIKTGLELLGALDVQAFVTILEEHLRSALHIEGEATNQPDFETVCWWRSAIEDTDQDRVHAYRDWLLETLRACVRVNFRPTWGHRFSAKMGHSKRWRKGDSCLTLL